jgi:diacylglycerol kinase
MINFKRLFKSFGYAGKGLAKTWREEQNLHIHTLAGLVAIGFGVYFQIDRLEWLILVITILLVLLMEIVNSAVERVTDVLKPRIHGYVKEIKDIMAAAVLLASLGAVIVGLLIFGPRILGIF